MLKKTPRTVGRAAKQPGQLVSRSKFESEIRQLADDFDLQQGTDWDFYSQSKIAEFYLEGSDYDQVTDRLLGSKSAVILSRR